MFDQYTFFGLPADLICWLMVFVMMLAVIVWSAVRSSR